MKNAWVAFAAIFFSALTLRAGHRTLFVPSLEITQVTDDNLNGSSIEPIADRVRRVTPTLALRYDSPRWSARFSAGMDSERYATRHELDDNRARERAAMTLQYVATPRLAFFVDGNYLSTNTLADLNTDTSLAASRTRGRRFAVTPSARLRLSSRTTLTATASSTATSVVNGIGVRTQEQTLSLQRHMTALDAVTVSYDSSRFNFHGRSPLAIRSQALITGWTHHFSEQNFASIHIGPRVTEGSRSADIGASLTRLSRRGSISISLLRAPTTVAGYEGNAQTDSVQTSFTFVPVQKLTLYATPAIFRTTHRQIRGSVYRITAAARYAVTSFLDVTAAYNRDLQNGTFDVLQGYARLSHSILTFGVATRWNDGEH